MVDPAYVPSGDMDILAVERIERGVSAIGLYEREERLIPGIDAV
jgi:hypothetical protein